jgi:hypothetical protein
MDRPWSERSPYCRYGHKRGSGTVNKERTVKYKVWFDYEEEDFVTVDAPNGEEAMRTVADQMVKEHGIEMDGMVESLNFEQVS